MLDPDRLTRISYLVGIYKALHVLHSPRLADEWVHLPNRNPIFAGETPLAYMIRGGLPAMQTVRRSARCAPGGLMPRRPAAVPPVTLVRQFDTHRLVPSNICRAGTSVLVAIADDAAHLQALLELDAATNDRRLAEHQRLPGIGVAESCSRSRTPP